MNSESASGVPSRPLRFGTQPVKSPATSTGDEAGKDQDERLHEFLARLHPRRARRGRSLLAAGLLGLLVILAGVAGRLWLFPSGSEPGLRAWDASGKLTIVWDPASRPLRKAERGVLEIVDGGTKSVVQLDRIELAKGTREYPRRSGAVDVHLTLFCEGSVISESGVRFLGPVPGR